MILNLQAGSNSRMGAHFDGEGTNFAVFSANAAQIDLCLFTDDGHTEIARCALPERTGSIWHGYAPGITPGTRYGFRAHGPYTPESGHRFNPNKLLLDPYTHEMVGAWRMNPAQYGYDQNDGKNNGQNDLSFSLLDSAPFVPKSVVSDPAHFPVINAEQITPANWDDVLIYEAHVKGLTQQHPGVPQTARGCYEGLASDAMIEHLLKLGITTLELLPVHAFIDEPFINRLGLSNYWGYNTIAFFAPEPRYFGPEGLFGFRKMVQRLREAGIEVILDVVFNHTAEGDQYGPTLCYRGLDNASYYRLDPQQPRYYVNDTGCGNTLNIAHPYVLRMVMDSLRFWVQQMGIAGFRFDLATTLAREAQGFDSEGGFFDALRQDPVLRKTRLIAEPWDIGPEGYQLGGFPPEFAEWNDTYRDGVRRFWRGDKFSAQQLSKGLLGTANLFDRDGRRSWSSINMITSHDGFTLADCTRYNERHNEANQEDGRDGHHANYSDNCGVEGESEDAAIIAKRAQRQRNMLATLFLSQGTPMLLAGDEISHTQQGNNNAYCQDNPISWLNWQQADTQLLAFVRQLSAFRKQHPVLRQTRFLHGQVRKDGYPNVSWMNFNGESIDWDKSHLARFCLLLRGAAEMHTDDHDCDDIVLILINRKETSAAVLLPVLPVGQYWLCAIDTSSATHTAAAENNVFPAAPTSTINIAGATVMVLIPVADQSTAANNTND